MESLLTEKRVQCNLWIIIFAMVITTTWKWQQQCKKLYNEHKKVSIIKLMFTEPEQGCSYPYCIHGIYS